MGERECREEAYKIVIGTATVFSVVSLLMLSISLPAMYSYIQNSAVYSRTDMKFCNSQAKDMEGEINLTRDQIHNLRQEKNRTKRSHYDSHRPNLNAPVSFFGAVGYQECPACCEAGDRGPNGDPGLPGMHGAPGPDGAPGRPGITPNASCIPERIFEPPPCLPCPQGPRGQNGHPGFPGEAGDLGIPGRPGISGEKGKQGPDGPRGPPGDRGSPGPPGSKGRTPEAKLIPGPPGDQGDVGPWGLPGHRGVSGQDGYPGSSGERGWPGPPGDGGNPGPSGPLGPRGESGPPGTPGTCVCQETEIVVEDTRALEYQRAQNRRRQSEIYAPGQFYSNPGVAPPSPGSGPPARRPVDEYDLNSAGFGGYGQQRVGLLRQQAASHEQRPPLSNTNSKAHESESGHPPPQVRILPEDQVREENYSQYLQNINKNWGRKL